MCIWQTDRCGNLIKLNLHFMSCNHLWLFHPLFEVVSYINFTGFWVTIIFYIFLHLYFYWKTKITKVIVHYAKLHSKVWVTTNNTSNVLLVLRNLILHFISNYDKGRRWRNIFCLFFRMDIFCLNLNACVHVI